MLACVMSIRIGNAPCSWGVVRGVEGQESLDWLQVLDQMQSAGYEGTELGDWGFMPDDAGLIKRELAARGLEMIGAFTPVRLREAGCHASSVTTALRAARLLSRVAEGTGGRPLVILADDPGGGSDRIRKAGRITAADGLEDVQWQALIEGTVRVARAVRDETGLRTVFHHHCGTFVETAAETARLLDATPADLVGLCLDTGHFQYAGDDPLAVLRRYRERVWHVHFKDCDGPTVARAKAERWDYVTAIRNGIFCGIGEGDVDHESFFAELAAGGYLGWIVVENEAPPGRVPPLTMALNDRAYLRSLGA
jgi:inosose dehydratase